MSVDRSELEAQFAVLLDPVEFPVSSRYEIERDLPPGAAHKRIESGDFSMSLLSIGNAVGRGDVGDYPYETPDELAAAVIDALEEKGHL